MNDRLMSGKEEAIGGFALSLLATIPQEGYIADLVIIVATLVEVPWNSSLRPKE